MSQIPRKPDPRREQAGRPKLRMIGIGSLFFKHLVDANGHENYCAAGGQQARHVTPLGEAGGSEKPAHACPNTTVG